MNTRINLKILLAIVVLALTLLAASYLVLTKSYQWLFVVIPFLFFQIFYLFLQQRKAYFELTDFVESVRYRDFSRRYSVKRAPVELKKLRLGFNEINEAFKSISKEKETQYQYLQKIMEMVNTGILSYDTETLDVQWINESLKQMLQIPYLKSILSLKARNRELFNDIISLKPGESKISTFHTGLETTKVLLSSTAFQTGERKFTLIGFQNINKAINETESEAWRKLLRVMTHEIMNSVAPISSLADTLQHRLQESQESNQLDNKSTLADVEIGIHTIKKRSESLLKFAETYRSLNRITLPELKQFFVCDLFENIYNLMEPTMKQKGIEMEILLKDPGLQLVADISLIEQVLINLVVNAIEAVKDNEAKQIALSGEAANHAIFIRISDNGTGMTPDVLDRVFVPFFTTKKNGTGIGLSLSRQIMQAHHGTIQVASEENKGTVFTLRFPE